MGGRQARIEVLGPIRVLGPDGSERPAGGPIARALLTHLVVRNGASADELIDAVWPDTSSQPSRSNLRLHLSRLRKVLAPDGDVDPLPRRNSRYVIDKDLVVVDAAELQCIVDDQDASVADLDRIKET